MHKLLAVAAVLLLAACQTPDTSTTFPGEEPRALALGAVPIEPDATATTATVRVYPPAPRTWTTSADWENKALLAQEKYQKACTVYSESVFNKLASKTIATNRTAAVLAQAEYVAAVATYPLLPPELPPEAAIWELPADRNFLNTHEYEYAQVCVDFVEATRLYRNAQPDRDIRDILADLKLIWKATAISRYALMGTDPPAHIVPLVPDDWVPVPPPPLSVTLSADPPAVQQGKGTTLQWSSVSASSVKIEPGVGVVTLNGTWMVTPAATTTYTATATGLSGTATATTVVHVSIAPPPPPPAGILMSGTGPQANPAPVPVSSKAVPAWTGVFRVAAGLRWGESRLDFNLYENTADGPVPQYVEMSLDGGPWLGTRIAAKIPDDVPDGDHQVRVVSWPSKEGAVTTVWTPIVVTKSTYSDGRVTWTSK